MQSICYLISLLWLIARAVWARPAFWHVGSAKRRFGNTR